MSDRTSFYPELAKKIAPADGPLAVLLPGLGAVSTTLIAGVHLIQKGLAQPIGSCTQLQKLRLGKRSQPRFVSSATSSSGAGTSSRTTHTKRP